MTDVVTEAGDDGEDQGAGARTAIRESMLVMATLRGSSLKTEVKARVRNLSEGGMMIETDVAFERGARLTVELPRIGGVGAMVAWSAPGRAGFMFDHPIDPQQARRPIGGGEGTPVYTKSLTVGPRALRVR